MQRQCILYIRENARHFNLTSFLSVAAQFTLGAPNSLPAAVTLAMVGMRQGGRRRVLMPPSLGFVNDQVSSQWSRHGTLMLLSCCLYSSARL